VVSNKSQIVIYRTETGEAKIDVRFDGDTVWLTQDMMAGLFGKSLPTINEHIKHIFSEGELLENSVIRNFRITARDGKSYDVKHYNLDAIISVGYRVKSPQGMQFRQWATARLREYIVKGFVMDDERLKNPDLPFDYFEELERRISDIRSSEQRFYRKITDIYATSVDYDPTSEESIAFFKTVQNKVHYAITGNTAAEIVVGRIDGAKPNLGLTNFRGSRPRKDELAIAKNYLTEEELLQLNALVEQYLIFATEQARRRVPMRMKDWIEKLHGFLTINDRDILTDAGRVSHELMLEVADKEYGVFKNVIREQQKLDSRISKDFDEAADGISRIEKS